MAYPLELRKLVLQKDAEGLTQMEIAEELSVSQSWVHKVLRCYASYGELIPPRKKPGRHAKINAYGRELLRSWVMENPHLTLSQLAERMTLQIGIPVNSVNVFVALKAMGRPKKGAGLPATGKQGDSPLA